MNSSIQCILLDIEGTTTSISFVKDLLFPYVRRNLEGYLESKWDESELKEDIELLKLQVKEDLLNGLQVPTIECAGKEKIIKSVIANVVWQMDRDRKITALKQLQGHMWKDAYMSGIIKGHVYEDVLPALKLWTSSEKKVFIYSSGSVEAQKLLFQHSVDGDLLQYISGHYDTKIGLKNQQTSYAAIAQEIGIQADRILFLTDIPAEAVAASDAGMRASLMCRPGNGALCAEDVARFSTNETFATIRVESQIY